MSGEKWKDLASLESLMFRQVEINWTRAQLLEEKKNNNAKIMRILRDNEMNFHSANLDENFEIRVEIKDDRTKVFEKEQMADDLGISPGSTTQKEVLINLTEKQQLTLEQFKRYFNWEPNTKLVVKKVKIKKPKKPRNKR